VLQRHEADGTFLAGSGQTLHQLAPVEGFMGSITLDHPEVGAFDLFVSGKSIFAGKAFAAPTDT
jgi:hypothetical protein